MLSIAPAQERDIPMIAELLEEMDAFYGDKGTVAPEENEAAIRRAVLSPSPQIHTLLAHDGDRLWGLATYSFLWPAVGTTRSLYLKELYVRRNHRRRGVGRLLMAAIFSIAANEGCSRVEWTADRSNVSALDFYKALGAPVNEGKVFYRLEGQPVLLEAARLARRANIAPT